MAGNNTRVNILVEGQTEESFVRDLLVPHLAGFSVWATARVVRTSKYHKGGAVSYVKICDQVSRWCLEDQTAVVTTMFDVYGLPANYPGVNAWNNAGNAVNQVALLENTLKNSVAKQNFLPYLQLHEFEALLFSDLDAFAYCDVDPAHIVGWRVIVGSGVCGVGRRQEKAVAIDGECCFPR
ncbi:DUF4276 family protein [Paraburkholderia sp. B3]|uniref:DUF4276 family protein n=1 Tax=Paraburkholderia sp. B3 TaxID=3134791 RepID=UPI0039829271